MQNDQSPGKSDSSDESTTDHSSSVTPNVNQVQEQSDQQDGETPPVQSSQTESSQKKGCRYSFLFIFLAASGLVFLVAGGILFMNLSPEMTTEASEVKKFKNEISPIIIPDIFSNQVGLRTDNFAYKFNLVIYGTKDENSKLVLVDFKVKLFEDKNQELQLLNNVLHQIALIPGDQETLDWEPKELNINGKQIEYEFVKGTDIATGSTLFMIRGPIPHSKNNNADKNAEENHSELIYLTHSEEDIKNGVKLIEELKTESD
jgi:hypothetical protein